MAGRRSNRTMPNYNKIDTVPGMKQIHHTGERVLQPVPEAPKLPTLQQTFTPASSSMTVAQSKPVQNQIVNNPPPIQSMDMDATANDKISPFKKFFPFKRKGGGRRKEKKARQNRRLRKMLTPKTALMALNELKGNFSQYTVTGQGTNFTAEINVNGVRYEGFGNSKIAAKNSASEKALREIIIQKMAKIPKKCVEINQKLPSADGTVNEKENDDVEMKNADSDDEDVPMIHLASFALHKLFSEWESQGYQIPDFRVTTGQATTNQPTEDIPIPVIQEEPRGPPQKKLPKARTELPPNAETLHPCTVLSHMRPGITYIDLGCEGTPPNSLHKVGVTIDDRKFIGEARSKKNARRSVAIDACNALFGTHFVRDDLIEQPIPTLS